jgi:hypothetical protein
MLVDYVRHQVQLGSIKIYDSNTNKNIADILTIDLFNSVLYDKHRVALLGC